MPISSYWSRRAMHRTSSMNDGENTPDENRDQDHLYEDDDDYGDESDALWAEYDAYEDMQREEAARREQEEAAWSSMLDADSES